MTKDVRIKIKTLIKVDDQKEEMLSLFKGTYYEKKSLMYVLYDDENEEGQISKCMLKISPEYMEMKKQGEYTALMTFCEGIKIKSVYNTPYGDLGFDVLTKVYELSCSEDEIRVKMEYDFCSDESVISSHNMEIVINAE